MIRFAGSRTVVLILAIAALVMCYGSTIAGMAGQWWNDEDMGHGFLVPLVALWIVWRERARWRTLPTKTAMRTSVAGFAVLIAAAPIQVASSLGGGLFMASVAFLLSVAGLVLLFGGTGLLRAWAFPLLLLLFMLPKLAVVYNQATLPLELLATRLAAGMLSTAGFTVMRQGNILDVTGHRVAVVEACSGIRYLLPLAFLAVVIAYVTGLKPWMRMVMLAASAPIAIVANALRVAASGLFPRLAEGEPHMLAGVVIFVACLAALVVVRGMFASFYARAA